MKKILHIASLIVILTFCFSSFSHPYSGKNHGGFTKEAEYNDNDPLLDNYMKLLGFTQGKDFNFTLIFNDGKLKVPPKAEFEDYFANGKKAIHGYDESKEFNYKNHTATQTAIDWLLFGSILEDNPMIRAAHHFHDPTTVIWSAAA